MYVLTGGPPDNVNNVSISPDTCSTLVQWNNASSDPLCGSVWYTVIVLTEGGMLIIIDNTAMTNYIVTGLNDSTVYHVSVTASNNAGSSDSTSTSVMTNSIGKFIMLQLCIYVAIYTFRKTMDQHVELLCSIPTTHKLMYMSKYLLASCIRILLAYN